MTQLLSSSALHRSGRKLNVLIRANEWWGYKFSPLLATAYATATLIHTTLWSLLPCLLLLLLSLTVGAIYVSLLNDWTDRAIDQAAGKTNRLADKSILYISLVLGLCLLVGLAFGVYFWTIAPAVSLLYLGAWVAYSLYSIPPVRLKVRSLSGIVADAAGAHMFPQLFTVALISYWAGHAVSIGWWWAVGCWSLTCGLRNILWHQLSDVAADRRAGINTFVTYLGERPAQWIGQWLIFPLEVLAFGFMLTLLAEPITFLALGLYVMLEVLYWYFWNIRPMALAPNQRILLNEYYITYYPLALLLVLSVRYPLDGLMLLVHVILFAGHIVASVQSLRSVVGHLYHRLVR